MIRTGPVIDNDPESPLLLEAFLPYRMAVTGNRISKAFAREYEKTFGLGIPEWRALAVLGRFQPVSSNEVSERTAMDKAKVSRAITRLIASGLITRRTNPADQRLLKLTLSRKGRKVYDRIVPRALDWERRLMDGLDQQERAMLKSLLNKLDARVDALED